MRTEELRKRSVPAPSALRAEELTRVVGSEPDDGVAAVRDGDGVLPHGVLQPARDASGGVKGSNFLYRRVAVAGIFTLNL